VYFGDTIASRYIGPIFIHVASYAVLHGGVRALTRLA